MKSGTYNSSHIIRLKPRRVGLFLTHAVQYHAVLWRGLSERPDLDVDVHFFSDQGVAETIDPGFGAAVKWDVPLLEGYRHTFLRKDPVQQTHRSTIPDFDGLFSRERFDVVFIHGYTHAFARQIIASKRKYGYKVVLRGEFTDTAQRGAPWWKAGVRNAYLRWFYSRVDHFCPIGSDALDHLRRRGIPPARMTLTPYSVDDQLIESQKMKCHRVTCREELGIAEGQIAFLFSGKLIARKQPLLLAKAAAQLASDPRLVLMYVGSGELLADVEAALRPLLGSRLLLPGFVNQSDLGRYFAAADVFVLPSAFDTWGLVVNEAMHWGLPCIVSDRTGSRRDLVTEGETGLVHEWDSVDHLAACMRSFLDHPRLAAQMGRNTAARIDGFRASVAVELIHKALVSV